MIILAYLNVSNVDDIESDSGYIFNLLLSEALEKMKNDFYIILPSKIKNTKLNFASDKCYFADMGTTKYEARYHFEWSDIETIVKNVNPDIILNNQVELTADFRALLDKNKMHSQIFTYCHYPALHIDSKNKIIIDSSLNSIGLGENIAFNILSAVNIADVFMIQSEFAKKMILDYAREHSFCLANKIHVIRPPYDSNLLLKNCVANGDSLVLYNHRLYDSYGTGRFIEFARENCNIDFLVTDPMAHRGKERARYNASPNMNRSILSEMLNVQVVDGGKRVYYIAAIDKCKCAIAPHREACVWSMSIIDCYCRWIPVVAPNIASFGEFVPKQLLFSDVEQEEALIRRLLTDKSFWYNSITECRKILASISPEKIANQIVDLFEEQGV